MYTIFNKSYQFQLPEKYVLILVMVSDAKVDFFILWIIFVILHDSNENKGSLTIYYIFLIKFRRIGNSIPEESPSRDAAPALR